jgi:hypothetical protein
MAALRGKSTERKAKVRGLTGVGHRDLGDFIGVEPDLALAALEHARGEALLLLQRHHLPDAADKLSRLRSGCVVWRRKGGVRNAAASLYIPIAR